MATTETVWITRERITLRHLRGLIEGLEASEALDYTTIRIMVVANEGLAQGVRFGRFVITEDNLPAEGMLIVGEDNT